jgi:predicted RND superfamily exporter protein
MLAERPLFRDPSQWAALGCAALLGTLVFTVVDLEPKVEGDFFFSSDDPQLQVEERLTELYGAAPQVLIAVRTPDPFSREHLHHLHAFTRAIEALPGVGSVQSLTKGPVDAAETFEVDPEELRDGVIESPFWRRLLLAPEESASIVVVRVAEGDAAPTVSGIDREMARFRRPDFELGASGVPYVAEQIRRGLARDVKTFSIAVIVAFSALVIALFRSIAVTVGTLVAALTACFATFLVRAVAGMETGILTPNLWTITFVLTFSHVVYLTASYWRGSQAGRRDALAEALRSTGPVSSWSLAANLLGFASLLLAPAKPLREFGLSGGIAALAAIACAYAIHPLFLRSAHPPRSAPGRLHRALESFFTTRHPWLAAAIAAACLALAPASTRVVTDPPLRSYFDPDGPISAGLEEVDRAGGTSPLEFAVRNADGSSLGDDESFERLMALQQELESDPAVGSVISIAILMAETERHWLSFLVSWEGQLERLEDPDQARVGRSFISEDRRLGRFVMRMHEHELEPSREEIVARLVGLARKHGFEVELAGGLFKLQGELSQLVRDGVVRGLGGLLAAFFLIAWVTSRSLPAALAMVACLGMIPLALFGFVALVGVPLDVIAAPAANVALPMGIDEMIHLGYAVRRSRGGGGWSPWERALRELWKPILGSALIVGAGFALFMLSGFPPSHRLGILVSTGAVLTDVVVLLLLPALATSGWLGRAGSRRSQTH